ncbi:hypothetical protein PMZ80_008268 [Knufia obscura]|uniref:Uncharacterized protein n=1 Tax=Knufia obscura TaxID=1635080 RepID=A0ABR0RGW6_9EURO|nr:hypothetical protein PMZ80_008268 [Knufia obscura]
MPESILDLERKILALEQQKINIEIKIWNAKDNLLNAQVNQAQALNTPIDSVSSGSGFHGHGQQANVTQNDVRPPQISTQSQENQNSRSADLNSTPQPRNVSPSVSAKTGSGDRYNEPMNNQGLPTGSSQDEQTPFNGNNQPSNNPTSLYDASPSVNLEQQAQVNAQYARVEIMAPSTSRPSTAMSNLRSQQMPPPPIRSPNPRQGATSPRRQPSRMQQRQIAAPTPRSSSTTINPFLHYGQANPAATSPRLQNLPPTQYPSFLPDDTSGSGPHIDAQSGNNTTQASPTSTHYAPQYGQGPLYQQAQQVPTASTFSFYTGLHGIPPNPALPHDYSNPNVNERSILASRTAPGLGKGLTKKSKDVPSQSQRGRGSDASSPSNHTLQRKRTPSVEITDQRPRQRLRSEDSRVMTPPLNDNGNDNIKSEDSPMRDSDPFGGFRPAVPGQPLTFGAIDEYNAAPPPTRPQRSNDEIAERENLDTTHGPPQSRQPRTGRSSQAQPPPTKGHTANFLRTGNRPPINENYNTSDNEEEPEPESTSPTSNQNNPRRRRAPTGTPALLAQSEIDNTDAPRPSRPRKAPGSYKTAEFKPLSPAEKNALEKRFCCQVAKIIGSKICVSRPPVPFDGVPILERLKDRLLGEGEGEGEDESDDKKYRTYTDFHTDAKRMLGDYVKLGQCEGCPFEVTGNARVMCYRMRLISILDARMKEIKQCIYECEMDFAADDWEGRRRKVDEWFSREDFEAASHDASK